VSAGVAGIARSFPRHNFKGYTTCLASLQPRDMTDKNWYTVPRYQASPACSSLQVPVAAGLSSVMQVVPGVVSHIICRSLCSCVFAQQVSSCVAFLGRLQNPRRVSVWAALHAGLAEGCLQHPDLRFCLDVTSSAWALRRIAALLSAYPCVGYSVMPLGRGGGYVGPLLVFCAAAASRA
jgi:hypothetical protein